MIRMGVYVPTEGWQPICVGTDERGELVWSLTPKEAWHQRMFPVRYTGDFGEQWIRASAHQRLGFEADSNVA